MADINFKTQALADLYANSLFEPNKFRTQGSSEILADVTSLDTRIANFQNIITDGAKAGSEDFPYDAPFLKREFMEEVVSLIFKRSDYWQYVLNSGGGLVQPVYSGPEGQVLLRNGTFSTYFGTTWNGSNFSEMSYDQMRSVLTGPGQQIFDTYMNWIDGVFAEGNKLKNNPSDSVNIVSSISERTLPTSNRPDIIYDRVATVNTGVKDALGNPVYKYYLIAQGAPLSDVNKLTITGTLNNQPVDSKITTTTAPADKSFYIEVDKNLEPLTANAAGNQISTNNLSPTMYLYYYMEARVRVLRGQLNMKEAVTAEIRDDLAKANSAYADLESQAGKTRAQSPDGKTVNPDLSAETTKMDFFEATNTRKGDTMLDNQGNDDLNNYANWGASRSALKAYIDRKSTQSQDAMLDYQTTLNRFNQAYEVMSKIQEKMDGLIKGQLRNVG